MRPSPKPTRSTPLALFAISFLTLLLEINYTRVLSIVYSPFFVYMVVGLALLGTGVAGVVLTVLFDEFAERRERAGPWLWVAFAVTTVLPLWFLRLFADNYRFHFSLALLLWLPFFLGGVISTAAFTYDPRSRLLYGMSTLGGVAGALLALGLIPGLGGPGVLVAIACVSLAIAALWAPHVSWRAAGVALAIALAVLGEKAVQKVVLPSQEYKWFTMSRRLPAFRHEFSHWDPVAKIDVISLGSQFEGGPRGVPFKMLTQDYSAPSFYLQFPGGAEREAFLGNRLESLAYWIRPRPRRALVIGVGGGPDVQAAHHFGAERITAVDIDGTVIRLLQSRYDGFVGGIGTSPRVRYVHEDGSRFLRVEPGQFDVIQLSGVDTDVASIGGTSRIAENFLYTKEAIRSIYADLAPNGVAALCWADFSSFLPVKERMYITVLAAMRELGISDPSSQLVVGGSRGTFGILIRKGPFTAGEIATLRDRFSRPLSESSFGMMRRVFPNQPAITGDSTALWYFPGTAEKSFFTTANEVALGAAPNWAGLSDRYNLRPTDNDSPFFFIMDRWRGARTNFAHLLRNALMVAVLAGLCMAVPALLRPRRLGAVKSLPAGAVLQVIGYFLLGLAFIAVEVTLLQKFVYYLGNPAYSVAVVIASLLLAMSAGNAIAGRLRVEPVPLLLGASALLLALLFWYGQVFDRFAASTDSATLAVRILLSVMLVSPLGLLMGVPFPTGLTVLGQARRHVIPWVLGANAAANALGTLIALLASWTLGFQTLLRLGGCLYVLGGVVFAVGMRWAPKASRDDQAAA